jgi:hypothetical protein
MGIVVVVGASQRLVAEILETDGADRKIFATRRQRHFNQENT